jgi:hypothetical protein
MKLQILDKKQYMFVSPTSDNRKTTCLLANCKQEGYTKIDGIVLGEVWIG